ncbi:MAG: tetratricopeptide repeat protein [Bacteroidia bacterium]|nr:tetratricopeptide repeat protein [Bacteroidia bacterium]
MSDKDESQEQDKQPEENKDESQQEGNEESPVEQDSKKEPEEEPQEEAKQEEEDGDDEEEEEDDDEEEEEAEEAEVIEPGKSEKFIDSNQQLVSIIAGVIIAIVGGYFGYHKLYLEPLEIEGSEQMYVAENYFEKDSLDLAINGDGNYLGFLDIIDEYSATKAGNLAKYYLGISYLKKGEYIDAIEYLEDFSSNDVVIQTIATGSIGDSYLELGEIDNAISNYQEAAYNSPNKFTSPIYLLKLGLAFESQGSFQEALSAYNEIKDKYKEAKQAQDIDKYISRAKMNI